MNIKNNKHSILVNINSKYSNIVYPKENKFMYNIIKVKPIIINIKLIIYRTILILIIMKKKQKKNYCSFFII